MADFWVVALCSLVEVYQLALMMEAARTSKTLVNFYQTTQRYNPDVSHRTPFSTMHKSSHGTRVKTKVTQLKSREM
jgi:hypothetical protein